MVDMAEQASTFLDAGEWAHPFGVGPWHFEGETLTIFVESDPEALRPYFPLPMRPSGPSIFRLTVHALRSDCGMGHGWAARNPRRSQFHEAVVAFNAEIGGVDGNWDPFMWTEAEPQLCVGREMYGFSMRLGEIALTRRPALHGWNRGDVVTAQCSRDGRLVFSIAMTLDRTGSEAVPPPIRPTPVFYTRRTLPRPDSPMISDVAIYRTAMRGLRTGEVWSGEGAFEIGDEHLQPLAGGKVVGARWSTFEMTKDRAELIERSVARREG
ncbi:MAG: acetoacetate decarboxylase family protein [Rhizobiaceae bacterium]|nr:acetoacetate decarboxylase family protein [Rhizobiaceae bacterium]